MTHYRVFIICQRTVNTIKCAQEGASWITKQGAVKKKMCICFKIKTTRTKWICAHANDLDQGIALCGI